MRLLSLVFFYIYIIYSKLGLNMQLTHFLIYFFTIVLVVNGLNKNNFTVRNFLRRRN